MTDEFWSVRMGRVTVYESSLEEALASLFRIRAYSRAMHRGDKLV